MNTPDLAVIVTSYQLPWHLLRVLESIAHQKTSRRLEVLVSDEGSTDETPQVVSRFAASAHFCVRFIRQPHNGFQVARCRNQGALVSTARHLLFVDGDCVLPPDHVEQHLRAWKPGTATCSYCVRLDQAASQRVTLEAVQSGEHAAWADWQQRSELRSLHLKAQLHRLIGRPTKPALRGGDFLIAREDYARVNGFDENFCGWGCEDDDFGLRLLAAGVRLKWILNRTWVYHLWHPPTPSRPDEWKRGANVAYFKRPLRLTRCLRGCLARSPEELTVRLAGQAADPSATRRLIATQRWTIDSTPQSRADLELLCWPGTGQFRGTADCRVLAIADEALAHRSPPRGTHVVLSPRGTAGGPEHVRLRLDDPAALWQALDRGPASWDARHRSRAAA
jgi:GT2 family glycosyltransferase